MNKTVIIGGGVAGLSAGIFLQKRGIPTIIYEKNSAPGGVCSAVEKNGFRFDLSCRLIDGVKSGRRHDLMIESGALSPSLAIDSSPFEIFENEGEQFRVEWNAKAFRSLLTQLATAADTKRIENFFFMLEKFEQRSREPKTQPFALLTLKQKKEFLLQCRNYPLALFKAPRQSLEKWIGEWESPSIRKLWRALYSDHYSLAAFFYHMACRLYGNSGFPRGGAPALINRLTAAYRAAGGELVCSAEADEIIVTGGRVTGVRCDKRMTATETVVAACDLRTALGKLLKGQLKIPQADFLLHHGDLFHPLLTVCYGLKKCFGIPASMYIEDEKGVDGSPDLTNYRIEIHSSEMTNDAAPAGKSALVVHLRCDYSYWKDLKQKGEEIERQCRLMAVDELNACLERRFPGFTDAIETVQVLSPLSYEEKAPLLKGSWRGFAPTPLSEKHKMVRTTPKCRGLYFCGQSVALGGGIDAITEDAYEAADYVEAGLKSLQ